MSRLKTGAAVLLVCISAGGADALRTRAWQILTEAVQAGGPDGQEALEMVASIDDPEGRAIVDRVFKSNDGPAIGAIAAGLSATQCVKRLGDLEDAIRNPAVEPKVPILAAAARAGTREAARVLAMAADEASQPAAGVAFGLLENMGPAAGPVLIGEVQSGKSAWSRETAIAILRRMKDAGAIAAFRSALEDSAANVRTAGALGLAQFGYPDGQRQLETAAGESGNEYRADAVVGLAMLGQREALERLKELLGSQDNATRSQTVWAIARSGNASLKDLVLRLGIDRQPAYRNMLAEKLLNPADPRDRAILDDMVANGDPISQLVAAGRLLAAGVSKPSEAAVARGLASPDEGTRRLALKIAAAQPGLRPEVAGQLSSNDPAVRMAAISAIGELHQRDRFSAVGPYLTDAVPGVSAAAARTLAVLDPAAARDAFEEGLDSDRGYVRIHSAAMLLKIAARPNQ